MLSQGYPQATEQVCPRCVPHRTRMQPRVLQPTATSNQGLYALPYWGSPYRRR